MIIVLGTITARPDTLDQLLGGSLTHVHRSRSEPGCISHDVHIDSENPHKLVFIEKWQDTASLATHFRVQASIDFVNEARKLSDQPPVIEIFEATPAKMR